MPPRIPDKALAGEYRAMLLQRFFDDRRGLRKAAKPAPSFKRAASPLHPEESNRRRCQILTSILLTHPEIFADVEEAFAHLPLPPACARLRDALHDYAAGTNALDRETLLAHLGQFGMAKEARLIEAIAAQEYRPETGLSPAEAAKNWWSWYILMDLSIDMLRQQRDEQQQFWSAHQEDEAAWARLIKYNQLLRQAQAGEYGAET